MSAKVATIEGVEVVTIPLTHYAELLECQRRLAERDLNHGQLLDPRRSLIERNPEVASFLVLRFGLVPMAQLLKLCRRRFGAARTPSRSAAYRYWQQVRKASKIAVFDT